MKDIFNGQIREERIPSVIVGLVVMDIILIIGAIVFLAAGMDASVQTQEAKMLANVLGWLCAVFAVAYPILAICFARRAKKYPRIAYLFINPKAFK